ncbi:MAG: nucleoside-diphosphate sugar epimerase/dehydratase [Candidatus Margulisbacteria bacterium]|nr:nucleoside-diphosphate sugar epimerase/dehydratase [Candidatus Margulisiibacteriota bacterium]
MSIMPKRLFLMVLADILFIILSLIISFFVLDGTLSSALKYWWVFPLILAIRIGTFRNFKVYHWIWQYASVNELLSLIEAVALSSILTATALLVFGIILFPFRVLFIDALLCFALIGGMRLAIRYWKETHSLFSLTGDEKKVLIIGAGDAGEMIAREMLKLPQLGYNPIGFIDDDLTKKGEYIHSLPILGVAESMPSIIKENAIEEVIIAIPSATGKEIRRFVELCEKSEVTFRIVPGVFELIDGSVHVSQIRNVQIEDLLGREPVSVDLKEIAGYLADAVILVTGAGGSIGAEICRQVTMFQPKELILFGRGENSIFNIELELRKQYPFLEMKVMIGDIRDNSKVNYIFDKYHPTVVFHAAAHKHVALMEANPDEAILNNILGTKNLINAADHYGVKIFVNISTDKAVNPTSIMGASKRIIEMLLQAKAHAGNATKFVSVRFGNVLDSRGSVVPIFKQQILAGGPVTVTHPEVKRYFMTIPEAVQLVIQAGAMGCGGEIFILDMGEPVKIIDLAKDLIKLSGLEVGEDIEIKIIGLRPGEKLFEEILTPAEGTSATKHKKIFVAKPAASSYDKLSEEIATLLNLAEKRQLDQIKSKIMHLASSL